MESKKVNEDNEEKSNSKNIKLEELNVNFETLPDSVDNIINNKPLEEKCDNNQNSSSYSLFTYLDLLRYIFQSLCNIIYYRFFDVVDDVSKIYSESIKKMQ